MKPSGISEIKKELSRLSQGELTDLCLRLARYKKENKELLTYLLLWGDNEAGFIQEVKEEMAALFGEVNQDHVFYAKKTIRKVLRRANAYIRYSGNPATEAEVLIYFCSLLRTLETSIQESTLIMRLYVRQYFRIEKAISKLHEDLQYDLRKEMKKLSKTP